jgi:hypothetical protein
MRKTAVSYSAELNFSACSLLFITNNLGPCYLQMLLAAKDIMYN